MDLRLDHGINEEEINKFSAIVTTDKFSYAEFDSKKGIPLNSFTHFHDSYEFIFPFTTVPLLRHHDAICVGEVGYCYPLNPNVKHGIEFDLNSSLVSIVVETNYLNKIKKELGYEDKEFYHKFLIPSNLYNNIWKFKITEDESIIDDIVKLLIIEGMKEDNNVSSHEALYFMNVRESMKYLLKNYTDPDLTIEKLAEQSNYSYTYFTKVFKKFMNDTPINHLNKLRLSRAKELMRDESLSLEEIALMSGYKNNSSFTESFKRLIGMNPLVYRKKYLKNSNFWHFVQ